MKRKLIILTAIALLISLFIASCDFIKIPDEISDIFFDCTTCYDLGKIGCETCGGDHKVTCARCSGTGMALCGMCHGSGRITCGACGGAGFRMSYTYSPISPYPTMTHMPCGSCGGSGGRSCTPRVGCSCNGGIAACLSCDKNGRVDSPDC